MFVYLTDPIIRTFCCGLSPFGLCKALRRQKKVMEKVSDKFTNELDIMNLLAKIRQSHEIIDNMLSSKKRELLKFSK